MKDKIELNCKNSTCQFPLCGCSKARAYEDYIDISHEQEDKE